MKLNLSILIAAIFVLMLAVNKSYLGVTHCIYLSAFNKCVFMGVYLLITRNICNSSHDSEVRLDPASELKP